MARQAERRHRRERLVGILIAVLGAVVLVVAILALHNPKTTSSAGPVSDVSQPSTTTQTSSHQSTGPSSPDSGHPSSGSAPATSPPSSGSGSSTPSAIGSQPLIVLNSTSTPGLAKQAASDFEGGGWNVTSYDENYSNNIASTCAYYDPNVKGAKHAAHTLEKQFSGIQRIAPRFAPAAGGDLLPDGPVVVVLTSDWTSN